MKELVHDNKNCGKLAIYHASLPCIYVEIEQLDLSAVKYSSLKVQCDHYMVGKIILSNLELDEFA